MKRSSRFSRAKLARFAPFLVTAPVLALGALGAGGAFVDCIPNPDTSGLPPFDGGSVATDAGVFTESDGGTDATIFFEASTGGDGAVVDSALPLGTVSGIVLDYTEGNGKGVLPGATISVSVPSNAAAPLLTATSDANGLFSIPGVQAGVAIEVNVFKATDTANDVAYSSTSLGVTVPAGQVVNVFPVLHEGCFQIVSQADAGAINLQKATCATPSRASASSYASMTFGTAAFDDTSGVLYSGAVRVEMIPLAYPGSGSDLSWAIGLPGVTTPAGLLGAAEYRVVKSNPSVGADGDPLVLHPGATVTIGIPTYQAATAGAQEYAFDTTTNAWTTVLPDAGAPTVGDAGAGAVGVVTMSVSHLAWWAAATGTASTTCVTGTIQAGGSGLANVFVHGVGTNYLGSSTGVTNAAGLFCLDVAATAGDGGASQLELFPAAYSGGLAYGWTPQIYPITAVGAGSCALGTGCQPLGAAITLAPALTCVSGNVSFSGVTPTPTLNVYEQTSVPSAEQSAGIRPQAYIGQAQIAADGGATCALGPPGGAIQLQGAAGSCAQSPNIPVPGGATATTCGGAGCIDAGSITVNCP